MLKPNANVRRKKILFHWIQVVQQDQKLSEWSEDQLMYVFLHLFIGQVIIKYLLCVKHLTELGDKYMNVKDTVYKKNNNKEPWSNLRWVEKIFPKKRHLNWDIKIMEELMIYPSRVEKRSFRHGNSSEDRGIVKHWKT